MVGLLAQFADEVNASLFDSLGIDIIALALQTVSFLILVFLLAKFAYPPILSMLDRHEKRITDAEKAAEDAKKRSEKLEMKAQKTLEDARLQAETIVSAANQESNDLITSAEEKAAKRANIIMEGARAELQRETEVARQELKNEVLDLVTVATEKIVSAKIDEKDRKLIQKTLEGCTE